jgi:hypothetical protein
MNLLVLQLLLASALAGGDPIQCSPDGLPGLRDDGRWDPCQDSMLVFYTFGVSEKDPRSPLTTPLEVGYMELRDSMIWHTVPSTFVRRPDGISAYVVVDIPLVVREQNGQLRKYSLWPRCSYFDADRTDDLGARFDFVALWRTPVKVVARRTSDSSIINPPCVSATNDIGDDMRRTDEDFELYYTPKCDGLPFLRWECNMPNVPYQPTVGQQVISYRCWTNDTTVFTAWYGTVSDVEDSDHRALTSHDVELAWLTDLSGRTMTVTVRDVEDGVVAVRPQQMPAGLYAVTIRTIRGTITHRIDYLE